MLFWIEICDIIFRDKKPMCEKLRRFHRLLDFSRNFCRSIRELITKKNSISFYSQFIKFIRYNLFTHYSRLGTVIIFSYWFSSLKKNLRFRKHKIDENNNAEILYFMLFTILNFRRWYPENFFSFVCRDTDRLVLSRKLGKLREFPMEKRSYIISEHWIIIFYKRCSIEITLPYLLRNTHRNLRFVGIDLEVALNQQFWIRNIIINPFANKTLL